MEPDSARLLAILDWIDDDSPLAQAIRDALPIA